MRIHSPHLVLIALSDTSEHVPDMGTQSSDTGSFLSGTEPFLDCNTPLRELFSFLLYNDFNLEMLEPPRKLTTRSSDCKFSSFRNHRNPFRDLNTLSSEDSPHVDSFTCTRYKKTPM